MEERQSEPIFGQKGIRKTKTLIFSSPFAWLGEGFRWSVCVTREFERILNDLPTGFLRDLLPVEFFLFTLYQLNGDRLLRG